MAKGIRGGLYEKQREPKIAQFYKDVLGEYSSKTTKRISDIAELCSLQTPTWDELEHKRDELYDLLVSFKIKPSEFSIRSSQLVDGYDKTKLEEERKLREKQLKAEQQLQDLINPNYEKGKEYTINCQRCVAAVEAQFRGYDVEALENSSKTGGWASFYSLLNASPDTYDPKNMIIQKDGATPDGFAPMSFQTQYGQPEYTKRGAKNVYEQFQNKMNEWGIGSRAVMHVSWSNSNSSHVVNVVNTKNGMVLIDGQIGGTVHGRDNWIKYLKRTTSSNSALQRVDQLPFWTSEKREYDTLKRDGTVKHYVIGDSPVASVLKRRDK